MLSKVAPMSSCHVYDLYFYKYLRRFTLTAGPFKCKFASETVDSLGYVKGKGSIYPQLVKTEAHSTICLPENQRELWSFLDFAGFYKNFVENMADLSASLSNKIKNSSHDKLLRDHKAKECYSSLKGALSNSPVLALPDLTKNCLRTDASGVGIGAVLCQYHKDTARPVSYASRKLFLWEIQYWTVEQECLALVWGISKLEYYLYGKHFFVEVYHKPLTFLKTFKCSKPRLTRWVSPF